MLDPYVRRIEAWLAAEPHLTAIAIVDRLRAGTPGGFGDRQLRTLQRFVESEHKLIGDLGNDEHKVREAATRDLTKIGLPAVDALKKAVLGGADAEVRRRAKLVLQAISQDD